MIAGVFLVSIDFTHVKTALHLKRIIFQQILAKVGAVVYEYYKNAFDKRCGKDCFEAGLIRARVATRKDEPWKFIDNILFDIYHFR